VTDNSRKVNIQSSSIIILSCHDKVPVIIIIRSLTSLIHWSETELHNRCYTAANAQYRKHAG